MKNNKSKDKIVKFSTRKQSFKIPKINQKAASIILMLIVSTGAGFAGGYFGNKNNTSNGQNNQQTIINNEGDLISKIAKDVGPSVVSVDVETSAVNDSFFGPQSYSQKGSGTGVIVSSEGVIVTNRHVVPKGVQKVAVTLSDGTKLDNVSVVGRTSNSDTLDVAFLKVNDKKGKTLVPAILGDSNKIEVGDRVIAIGNALGRFQNTVTSGIISGFGRDLQAGGENGTSAESLQDLFQTDAAINEGNSGGPLVNIDGEVIGINTAIAGNAQNIGFSIPINDIQGLIKSVLKNGKLQRPYLGVRYVSLSDDYAYQFNLGTKRGAYIAPSSDGPSILSGSPAQKAGLKEKDIITKVNDMALDEKTGLSMSLAQQTVGDKVKLTVLRGDKEVIIYATLGAAPEG